MCKIHQQESHPKDDELLHQVIFCVAPLFLVCQHTGGAVYRQERKDGKNNYDDPDHLVSPDILKKTCHLSYSCFTAFLNANPLSS